MSVKKIIKHGKVCWQFDVVVNGKRIRKMSSGWNRKQCLEAERSFLADSGVVTDLTYKELFSRYISHMALQMKPSTIRKHTDTNRNHIAPYFDGKRISKITKADILAWQDDLLTKTYNGHLYSNNMLKDIQSLFHATLQFGVECELIPTNPFKFKRVTRVEKKEELTVWTPSQFDIFASNISDPMHLALFRTLYFGGLRKGELIALNVEDFDGNGVHISKTYDRYNSEVTAPKTANSYRYVELDKRTCEAIQNLIELYPDVPEVKRFPLFGYDHRISPTSLERWKNEYWKLTDLPFLTLHGFRHSHASYLLEKGIRTRDVALRLGNTEEMVIKRYSHLINKSQSHITALFD